MHDPSWSLQLMYTLPPLDDSRHENPGMSRCGFLFKNFASATYINMLLRSILEHDDAPTPNTYVDLPRGT